MISAHFQLPPFMETITSREESKEPKNLEIETKTLGKFILKTLARWNEYVWHIEVRQFSEFL